MSPEAESFIDTVTQFCAWAEGEEHRFSEARAFLLSLMRFMPFLERYRGVVESEEEHAGRGSGSWEQDMDRFSDLPFNHYRCVFDPLSFSDRGEVIVGSLWDDFADIYGDLYEGLEAHKKGYSKEALGIWAQSYFFHWGYHASHALNALDEYYRQNQGSEQVDGANE